MYLSLRCTEHTFKNLFNGLQQWRCAHLILDFFQPAFKYHLYGVQVCHLKYQGEKAGRISDPNTMPLKPPKGKPDLTWTHYIWKPWYCCNALGIFSYGGDPALTFLQGDNQQKTVFDRRSSLPAHKASNPVQERDERKAKTPAGSGERNPGSLEVWKETKQKRRYCVESPYDPPTC